MTTCTIISEKRKNECREIRYNPVIAAVYALCHGLNPGLEAQIDVIPFV